MARIVTWLEQEPQWHGGQIQPADVPLGLPEVINIFEPIYTDREISHRKSNFLASLEKLKALAPWGPRSYLISVASRKAAAWGGTWDGGPLPTHSSPIPPCRLRPPPSASPSVLRQHSPQHVRAKGGPGRRVSERQSTQLQRVCYSELSKTALSPVPSLRIHHPRTCTLRSATCLKVTEATLPPGQL